MLKPKKGLIDPSGRPLATHPAMNGVGKKQTTPEQEVSRMIRRIEAARITGGNYFLATLLSYAEAGWKFIHQNNLQTNRCEVTIATHIKRNIHGQLEIGYERIIRLGDAFLPALQQLQAEALQDEDKIRAEIEKVNKEKEDEANETPPAGGQDAGSGN